MNVTTNRKSFFTLLATLVISTSFAQVNLPYEQKFLTAGLPSGWTIQYAGITASVWTIASGSNAGGGGFEAIAAPAYQTGISRLVTPAIITNGFSELRFSFRQQLRTYSIIGMVVKIQSSSDAISWTDEEFVYSGFEGSLNAEYRSIKITHNLGNITYLAFAVDGDHSNFLGWYIDDVYAGEYTAQPVCPITLSPNSNQTNVPLIGALTWRTGIYSMGNTVYLGTDNPPTNLINGVDLGLVNKFEYPPLLPNTQYRWKITTYNNNGVQPFCSNNIFTTMPAIPLPYSESFNSYSFPAGWVPQVYGEIGHTPVWQTSSWLQAGGTSYELQCEMDYENATGLTRMISPPMNTNGLTEISLGMTHKIKSYGTGLIFKIQTSADGISWTDEHTWSNASGSLGPEPFTLAIHHNLGNYTFIGFTVEGDFCLAEGWYIDNIEVNGITGAPGCISQAFPADSSSGIAPGIDLSWAPVAAAKGYKLYLGTDYPPANIYNGLDVGNTCKIDFTTLAPGQSYHWRVVPYNQSGMASGCPVWLFSTFAKQTIPFAEDFNSPLIPTGWLAQWTGYVDSTIWYIKPIVYAPLAPYTLKALGEYRDDRGSSRMILPPLDSDSAFNLSLGFKYFFFTYDTGLIIGIQSSPDCRNWTDENWSISSNTNDNMLSNLEAQVLIPANYGGTRFIAFVVEGNLEAMQAWYIDSVRVQKFYIVPACITTPSPPNSAVGIGLNAKLAWNKNPQAMGYRLYLGTDNPPTNILNGLDMGSDTSWHESVFSQWTQYFWKVIPYNNAGNAINCPVWSFTATGPQSLPFYESFNTSNMPSYWSIEQFGKKIIWTHPYWNTANGIKGEMQAKPVDDFFLSQGISRLVSPPINTTGLSMLTLSFRHTFEDDEKGVFLRIQTSTDGLHWTDESWYYQGGNGDINNDSITVSLGNNIGTVTFISFTLEGGLGAFAEWTIDDITVTAGTAIPACSNYIYPPDGMISAAELSKLSWEINPLATSYRLYLGTDNPPTNVINNISTGVLNEYLAGPLQQGTQYFWQVKPQTSFGSPSGCTIQTFTVTENKSLPYTDNFNETYFPAGWRQEYSGGVNQDIWSVADTNLAGGQSPELKAVGVNTYGLTRLISPPLNTEGCAYITLNFKHLYKYDYYNSEMYLQSSLDGINWTNEALLFTGGQAMTYPEPVSVKIHHNLGTKTYLAFMVTGNHHAIRSWQIDNIFIVPAYPEERPEIHTISAPSYVCQGSPGVSVTLSGSQLNAEYKLYKNSTLVGSPLAGTGLPVSWSEQLAGTYNIIAQYNGEYAMMAGAKLISNTSKPIPEAGPDVSISQGQSAQLDCTISGGTAPFNYSWTPAAGLNDSAIANPLASPSATTSYTVSVTDARSCSNADSVLVTVIPAGLSINGSLVYFNSNLSALSNCQIELIKEGVTVQTTYTDPGGAFIFPGVTPGDYTFLVDIDKAWGGGNAVDALQIMQHFVGMIQLTGVPLLAADVIYPGPINAVDALTVMQRFVGFVNSFVVGDWIIENPTVNVSNNNVSLQIKALCTGDVNASFIPSK